MFNYTDFMRAAIRAECQLPETNVVVDIDEAKVVMSQAGVIVTFTQSVAKPYTDINMHVAILFSDGDGPFKVDVHLENIYKTPPEMVGSIAKTTFLQVTSGRTKQSLLDRTANFINNLFLDIKPLPQRAESTAFEHLTQSVVRLGTDDDVTHMVSADVTKTNNGVTNMLFVTYVIPDNVPRLSLTISEQDGESNPKLLLCLNWVTLTGQESDLQTWYIEDWASLTPYALIQNIQTEITDRASSTLPDNTYDGIVTLLDRLTQIHSSK